MATTPNQFKQVEGQWEELVQHSGQFAGRRVRVTVLSDEAPAASSLSIEIRRWLSEGKTLEITSAGDAMPNTFGDGLVEKFRKQGLVL